MSRSTPYLLVGSPCKLEPERGIEVPRTEALEVEGHVTVPCCPNGPYNLLAQDHRALEVHHGQLHPRQVAVVAHTHGPEAERSQPGLGPRHAAQGRKAHRGPVR